MIFIWILIKVRQSVQILIHGRKNLNANACQSSQNETGQVQTVANKKCFHIILYSSFWMLLTVHIQFLLKIGAYFHDIYLQSYKYLQGHLIWKCVKTSPEFKYVDGHTVCILFMCIAHCTHNKEGRITRNCNNKLIICSFSTKLKKLYSVACRPQANYTDRAAAAC
jgi:hypothetical protein